MRSASRAPLSRGANESGLLWSLEMNSIRLYQGGRRSFDSGELVCG